MTLWRVVKASRVTSAFDGEGARLYGGRWNSPGLPAVYTSGSKALALLEMLVHLDPIDAPPRWVAFRFDIPDGQIEKPELSAGWATHAGRTRRVGDDWLSSRRTLALAVPSVIVPEELNCLLNPLHPDFERLEAGPPLPFTLDFRLSN